VKQITVTLKNSRDDSYQIDIGAGILDQAAMMLGKSGLAGRCVILTDSAIDALHGKRVQKILEKTGLRIERIVLPPGEETKTMASVLLIAERLTSLGADRQTLLIALGGGVIGDLTGFVASIYMRGIPFVQMPTTLLAQVDSSIGGKTGVDDASGKNMLGTFYQPKRVFIDTDFLKTLPDAIFRSGFAEVIKYGAIENPGLLDDIEKAASENGLRDPSFLLAIVAESCRIKKGIVEMDEREGGLRRVLNFGHTFGHALEAASGYRLSHGEAVAIGMTAAAGFSQKLHGLPAEDRDRITTAVRAAGLPGSITEIKHRLPDGIDINDIIDRLQMDKKALLVPAKEGKTVNFVMLRKLGEPFMNGAIPGEILRETLKELTL
jgi:3-dehydroquinate synthase